MCKINVKYPIVNVIEAIKSIKTLKEEFKCE